jgi:hypothetical protein
MKMVEDVLERIDRTGWGDGPWTTEPDRVDFEHAGNPCLLLRNMYEGNWCGYVAVSTGHPVFEVGYADVPDGVDCVHGGLTYADHCNGPICHVPREGQPDDVWWLGFDCGHGGNYMPGLDGRVSPLSRQWAIFSTHYWTVDEVKEETMRLAKALAALT